MPLTKGELERFYEEGNHRIRLPDAPEWEYDYWRKGPTGSGSCLSKGREGRKFRVS